MNTIRIDNKGLTANVRSIQIEVLHLNGGVVLKVFDNPVGSAPSMKFQLYRLQETYNRKQSAINDWSRKIYIHCNTIASLYEQKDYKGIETLVNQFK